jgi:DNA-binding transcriptional MerR regulator
MSGHGEKFGRKKEIAISALLTYPTVTEAAASCGVSESTLRRWLRLETFVRQYRQERTRMLESTVNFLRQKSAAAVATLAEVADDKTLPAGARVSAARSIVELSIRGAEVQDLAERIVELETLAERERGFEGSR